MNFTIFSVHHRVNPALRILFSSCLLFVLVAAPNTAWPGDSQNTNRGHRLIDRQRIENLRERIADLKDRLKEHREHHHNGNGSASVATLQAKITALENSVNTLLSADSAMLSSLQTAQSQIAALQTRIATLENRPVGGVAGLENYVTLDPNPINGVTGPHLLITGVNVHIRSGSQATDDGGTPRGLGNLIIGYNETSNTVVMPRSGSHNLVMGTMNGFSSVGGAVLGQQNQVTGRYAAVLAGELNVASGISASILGGNQNTALGRDSTVYGGQLNVSSTNSSIAPTQTSGGCPGC